MEHRDALGLSISELADAELLSNTRALIGRSNQVLAALLAHLGEVEARGLHRQRACSSLYAYCVYELRLSEDEAVRRVTAARLVRQFPTFLDAIATGELHLTGLLMLGPHLTRGNHLDVLARAKHRTRLTMRSRPNSTSDTTASSRSATGHDTSRGGRRRPLVERLAKPARSPRTPRGPSRTGVRGA